MKTIKTSFLLPCLFSLLPLCAPAQEKVSKIKIFVPEENAARTALLGLLDIDHYYTDNDGGIISEIDESMLSRLKATSYRYEILVPDMAKELDSLNRIYYASVNDPQKRVALEQPGSIVDNIIVTPAAFQVKSTLGGYYNFTEIETAIDNLVAAYPAIASKTSIGVTVEGRNLWVVKISDNVATDEVNEPELLYMGLQHCREAIGGSSMIFFMQYLCERYALDSRIKDLVDNREIYIIPCINPDGWEYNRTSMGGAPGGNWRKNRSPSGGGNFGVDLNRNWGVDWSNCNPPIMGSVTTCGSSDPAQASYWGTAAFSEIETQSVRNFTKAHHLVIGFDQHSYGPYYSIPFGRKGLHTMSSKGTQFYTAVPALMGTYNGMRAADSYDALGYEVAGGFKDWMLMGELGTSIGSGLKDTVWAMTGESAAGGTTSYWAPASQILRLSKGICFQNLQLAYAAGSYADIQDANDIALTSKTGNLSFNVKRIGLTDAPVTVTLIPIENISSVGAPVTIPGMTYYQNVSQAISYTLPASLVNGQRIRYAWKVTTGGYTYSDTVIKFLNPVTLFTDDMEGSFATNWLNPAGSTGSWQYTASGGYNSTKALSESAAGTNYTANQVRICLYNGTFNLSGATAAYLTFMTRHRIENFNDKVEVQVSTDGTTWISLGGNTTIKEPGTVDGSKLNGVPALTGVRDYWTPEVFDLDAFRGNATVSLRFVFTSDNDPSTFKFEVDDGIYIDNIKLIKSNTALIVLPVTFTSFNGSLQSDGTVKLNWTAVVDQAHDYFVAERSPDGIHFTSMGYGPQNAPYFFVDQDPHVGNNYYRIRQVDKDGSIAYSTVIHIPVRKPATVHIYPNPVKDICSIQLNSVYTGPLKIEITDVQGRILYTRSVMATQNTTEVNIDMKKFLSQVYILKILDRKNGLITMEKIMKQ